MDFYGDGSGNTLYSRGDRHVFFRERKEKEIYNLKHDLIAEQIESENDKKEIMRLDTQNRDLLLNKARLESSLEESLLGKIEDEDTSEKDETEQEDTAD